MADPADVGQPIGGRPSAISGAFRKPFPEQVAFFRGKLGKLVPTARWDDITAAEHDTAFMVAGAQKADLLADLAAAVDRAIAEGKSLEAFRKDFDAAVARNDWHGWTGEGTKGGRAWRTRTIYRTNATVTYAAGRRAQLEAGNFAYWIYKHGGSRDPRPEHLSWNGMALPPDHPFWTKHYPPSDWGCSCYVVGARSAAGVKRLGGRIVDNPPPGWNRIDPRTGEPAGIGKGWGYAPGARVAGAVIAAAGKIGAMDRQIAKAFMGELPPETRDAIAQAYRRLPSVADDLRRFAQRTLAKSEEELVELRQPEIATIGALTSRDAGAVNALLPIVDAKPRPGDVDDVSGFDFSVARSEVRHVEKDHGVASEPNADQRGVRAADYARLPELLARPDAVEPGGRTELGRKAIIYSRRFGSELFVAVFEVRGAKARTLALKTFYIKTKG